MGAARREDRVGDVPTRHTPLGGISGVIKVDKSILGKKFF
jgi:hypothetical protein